MTINEQSLRRGVQLRLRRPDPDAGSDVAIGREGDGIVARAEGCAKIPLLVRAPVGGMLDRPCAGPEPVAGATSNAVGPCQTRCRVAPSRNERIGEQGPSPPDHRDSMLLGALARLRLDLSLGASQPAGSFAAQFDDRFVHAPAGGGVGLRDERMSLLFRGRDLRFAFVACLLLDLLQQSR